MRGEGLLDAPILRRTPFGYALRLLGGELGRAPLLLPAHLGRAPLRRAPLLRLLKLLGEPGVLRFATRNLRGLGRALVGFDLLRGPLFLRVLGRDQVLFAFFGRVLLVGDPERLAPNLGLGFVCGPEFSRAQRFTRRRARHRRTRRGDYRLGDYRLGDRTRRIARRR